MNWARDNIELVLRLTLDHIQLSLIPIVLGGLISLPIGWLAFRFPKARGVVLGSVGIIYTIPSLALFVILPPLLGLPFLSPASVIIALTLYAVAIMVRSVADAFESVDPQVLCSATALGFEGWQRVLFVELPLAGPVIIAGLRVVAVSTVSLVTVGVLVGVQSLGYLFTDGFQRRIEAEILTGIVMTIAVAALFDFVLLAVGRALLPWHKILQAQATSKQVATR